MKSNKFLIKRLSSLSFDLFSPCKINPQYKILYNIYCCTIVVTYIAYLRTMQILSMINHVMRRSNEN